MDSHTKKFQQSQWKENLFCSKRKEKIIIKMGMKESQVSSRRTGYVTDMKETSEKRKKKRI